MICHITWLAAFLNHLLYQCFSMGNMSCSLIRQLHPFLDYGVEIESLGALLSFLLFFLLALFAIGYFFSGIRMDKILISSHFQLISNDVCHTLDIQGHLLRYLDLKNIPETPNLRRYDRMSRDTVFSMRNDCPGNSDQQDWDLFL